MNTVHVLHLIRNYRLQLGQNPELRCCSSSHRQHFTHLTLISWRRFHTQLKTCLWIQAFH